MILINKVFSQTEHIERTWLLSKKNLSLPRLITHKSMYHMNIRQLLIRYLIFITGLLIMAIGIGMGVQANLGISPISCPPYVLSLELPRFTIGEYTILLHILLILLQVMLLRRNFEKIQYMQLLVAIVFGLFCDIGVAITAPLSTASYHYQLLLMLASCIVQAIGISLEITAGVLLLAGEGAMLAISRVTGIEFSRVKIASDTTFVLIGVVLSLCLSRNIIGIREGTIISAFLIGLIIRWIQPTITSLVNKLTRTSTSVDK